MNVGAGPELDVLCFEHVLADARSGSKTWIWLKPA